MPTELAQALETLRKVIDAKCRRLNLNTPWMEGGTPCTQLINYIELYIYEGGPHSTIYPRIMYVLPYGVSGKTPHLDAVLLVTRLERMRASKDHIVAFRDLRMPASVPSYGGDASGFTCRIGEEHRAKELPEVQHACLMSRALIAFSRGHDEEAQQLRAQAALARVKR